MQLPWRRWGAGLELGVRHYACRPGQCWSGTAVTAATGVDNLDVGGGGDAEYADSLLVPVNLPAFTTIRSLPGQLAAAIALTVAGA